MRNRVLVSAIGLAVVALTASAAPAAQAAWPVKPVRMMVAVWHR
jgi:hypothetical protein